MPPPVLGRAILVALALLALAGPAGAEAGAGYGPQVRYPRHAPARMLPPEVRYRDPRYVPQPPRRVRRVPGPPGDLIQAYLPRYTERPMYNEPPSRFPQR